MAITVVCTCGARFRVKDEWAGRKAKCTKCKAVVMIPAKIASEPLPDLTNDDPLGLGSQPADPPVSNGFSDLTNDDPLGASGQPTAQPAPDGFSDLFNEDIPAAATTSPHSGGAAALGNGNVQISVESDVQIANEEEVAGLIHETLRRHFSRAKAGTYSQVELEAHILDWNDHGTRKLVAISFFGNVNGKRISKNFSRDSVGSTGAANLAAKMWDSAAEAVRGARVSQQMAKFIEDIVDDACVHIDKAAGRKKASSSKLWEIFDIAKCVVAGVAILITIGVALAKGGTEDLKASLFMAVVVGAVVFIPIHVLQIFSMPTSFYTQDPRGRRVLSRWKVKSVAALKVRLGAMVAISCVAIVGFWMMISSDLNAGPGRSGSGTAGTGRSPERSAPSRNGDSISMNAATENCSRMAGGAEGHTQQWPALIDGRAVVGVAYYMSKKAGAMASLEPHFDRRNNHMSFAKVVRAKEGYVLGGMLVHATDVVHRVKLSFMRLTPDDKLDPEDTYQSDWLGGSANDHPVEPVKLDGNGRRVVGFRMRNARGVVSAIGLIYD